MYKISPYTPLFFNPSFDVGLKSRYVQMFFPDDHILLQIIASKGMSSPSVYVTDELSASKIQLDMLSWKINDDEILYFKEIVGLREGVYCVEVEDMVS